MPLLYPLNFSDHWRIHSSSMRPMTAAVSNQPIRSIVSTTAFERDFMAHVPFLTGHNFHFAQVAYAIMSHKDFGPCFCCDAYSFH